MDKSEAYKLALLKASNLGKVTPHDQMGAGAQALFNILGDTGKGVYKHIKDFMEQGYTPGSGDITAVKNAANVVGDVGMMGMAIPRAAGKILSASGPQVMARKDAQKLVEQMREKGATNKQIAESLNERFASILDEPIKESAVLRKHHYERTKNQSVPPDPKVFEITNFLKDAGVPITSVKQAGGGTTYVKFRNPHGEQWGTPQSQVRFANPADPHLGRNARPNEIGRYFDTSPNATTRKPDPVTTVNSGGEPYTNPEALKDALKWATSSAPRGQNWLVSPDRAPISIHQQVENMSKIPASPQIGPIKDPNQLDLLSKGMPGGLPLNIIEMLKQLNPDLTK